MDQKTDIWSASQEVRSCSNCDRPSARETDVRSSGGRAIYSCSTCGQREAVSWQRMGDLRSPGLMVENVEVVEYPHIILGEH